MTRHRRKSRSGNRHDGSQQPPVQAGWPGGRYRPLAETDMPALHEGVVHILSKIGLSDASRPAADVIVDHGGQQTGDGRVVFPPSLVEDAIAGFQRGFTLHGQLAGHELLLSDKNVYMGSGGASPNVVDLESGRYRAATLADLHDAARLVDALDNVHFFSRPVTARDLPDEYQIDINTAFACLAGTSKHVCVSAFNGKNAKQIIRLCHAVAGSARKFREEPFLSFNINHVTPPLRFADDAMDVIASAVMRDVPVHANVFGQIGASSPVHLAGSLVQSMAESLAGGIYAWMLNPKAKVIFGPKPMITDLRTGGLSGGGGEQAIAMAAAAQFCQYYGLPNVSIAGASDSKLADAQSGYEKCLTITLAAQAGSNLITQAAGTLASLMATAFDSYVIDNDMLGSIMSSLRPLEVCDDSLGLESIDDVVHGPGHFLGEKPTYENMKTAFYYPDLADRRPHGEWAADGSSDIRDRARIRARELLAEHRPRHLDESLQQDLAKRFGIRIVSCIHAPA
ncbi:MAG: trimethylamine methyltransferase [Gammaproteobacteria bacterium]|nr:trimethylamine methyltransferase [Gammaproteobacteria bacterium]MYD76687.1 trimethylamine methyltransferase [Gammaproteobacteria bacterium]